LEKQLNSNNPHFNGRKLLIATKHRKEQVIKPIFDAKLGLECVVKKKFDSDKFGTFSGEIERKDSPLETARKKCLEAIKNSTHDLVIASEGSFGPHPDYLFIPANEEILILIDLKNGLEITSRILSTETNFHSAQINSKEALDEFLEKVQFPSHGVIIKDTNNPHLIYKGIKSRKKLYGLYRQLSAWSDKIFIETDMRAMHNPTRMKVIEQCAQKLLEKIESLCPDCGMPGFSVTKAIPGLPCELCHTPGRGIKQLISTCHKCTHTITQDYPNNKKAEDPKFCDVCNP